MSTDREILPGRRRGRISWKEVPWVLLLGVALSLHLWFPRIDTEPLNDTYSAEVGGRNAFYQLTAHRAPAVERSIEPLYRAVDRMDLDSTLCLLGPVRYPTEREWKSVFEWVADGGSLFFAARWDDAKVELPQLGARIEPNGSDAKPSAEAGQKADNGRGPGHANGKEAASEEVPPAGSVPANSKSSSESQAEAETPTNNVEPGIVTDLAAPDQVHWESRGRVVPAAGAREEVLVRNAQGPQVIRIRYGNGLVVVCASDQLFSNASLFDRKHDNGVLATRLLEAAGKDRPVVFDESLNASGTPQVVGLLLDPHLRPLTIQILVVLVLFGWRGGRRFGGLLPKGAGARHNLTDHTDALGNLYYKSRNGSGAVRDYLEQLKRELRLHRTSGADVRALAPVALRSGIPAEEIKAMISRAEMHAKSESTRRREAAETIRSLARLRRKTPPPGNSRPG